PNDPRNASAIRLGSDAKPTSSYIEETYDTDSDLGRSFEALMGNAEYSDFDSLLNINPPPDYDSLIYDYASIMGISPDTILHSPWTDRAITNLYYRDSYTAASKKAPKRKYKPVDRKVRPVPTYFPDPRAQEFKEIPAAVPLKLPVRPVDYHNLDFSGRVTLERLEDMLRKIPLVNRGKAFAWNWAEKGFFSRDYYPDYEIPTIEHIPWQSRPIPKAILGDVISVIKDNEEAGRFEPTTSSYRSSLFAVAKKPGSDPPVSMHVTLANGHVLFKHSIRRMDLSNKQHWFKASPI
ncbi:MAG: hypothetical protein NXY57DRAFT_1045051, partial [Lentinula lateritia]